MLCQQSLSLLRRTNVGPDGGEAKIIKSFGYIFDKETKIE